MAKSIRKRKPRNPLKTWITNKVAEIYRVTPRHVNMVIEGARCNDDIIESYMTIEEGATKVVMLEAVNKLVPFENAAL